jgi:hypothetical protein
MSRAGWEKVADLLEEYPFDVLLGSVHWIGAWLFDALDWTQAQEQWVARGAERVWDDYTTSLEELASTRTVDVLAHPDLAKGLSLSSTPPAGGSRALMPTRIPGCLPDFTTTGFRSRPPPMATGWARLPGGSTT